jgi:hypothetical protein
MSPGRADDCHQILIRVYICKVYGVSYPHIVQFLSNRVSLRKVEGIVRRKGNVWYNLGHVQSTRSIYSRALRTSIRLSPVWSQE